MNSTDYTVTLPSGNGIDGQTWEWMKADGTWEGWLDARMYPLIDREFMTRELAHGKNHV